MRKFFRGAGRIAPEVAFIECQDVGGVVAAARTAIEASAKPIPRERYLVMMRRADSTSSSLNVASS
jgi:hypothetical protein